MPKHFRFVKESVAFSLPPFFGSLTLRVAALNLPHMETILLITPDFLLILLGAALAARFGFGESFWRSAEKLVFYVLFPPMLFTSIATASMTLEAASHFVLAGVVTMLLGVLSAAVVRFTISGDPVTHASIFQCGFRYNSYIGVALAARLFGNEGSALLALLIAVWVPISNAIAVAVLAHAVAKRDASNGHLAGQRPSVLISTVRAVVGNPLIIATLLGLLFNTLGVKLPGVALATLKHLGSASLAMGLLCIGAGMRLGALRSCGLLLAAAAFQRLVLVTIGGLLVLHFMPLAALPAGVVILFASLPTAQSCYVMTANMRGDAAAVANLTTLQTLASMITLPIWIELLIAPLGTG